MPGTRNTWIQYLGKRIDNFGSYPDPDGAFPKPDINIICPPGTSITALGDGIVSGINTPGNTGKVPAFGEVVTILLNNPHNNLATHDAYLHLHSVSVQLGQMVSAGTEVGVSGSNPQNAAVGFAFYPGDNYGFGTEWNKYIQTPDNQIDPRLNPVSYLNQVAQSGGDFGAGVLGGITGGATGGLTGVNDFFSQVQTFFSDPARIIKILIGFIMVVAGVALFVKAFVPVDQIAKGAAAIAA